MEVRPAGREEGRAFYWLMLIGVSSIISIIFTLYGLLSGFTMVYPHLYYLPIVIAAYRYPRQGVFFTVVLGIVYFVLVYFFFSTDMAVLAGALVRAVIFVLIAVTIAILSLRLRAEEVRYQQIFNTSEIGVLLVRLADLSLEEINQWGAKMVSSSPEELTGSPLTAIWPEAAAYLSQETLWERGVVADIETRFLTRMGGKRYVLLSAALMPGDVALLTAVDLTARKRTEAALEESQRAISTLLSNLPGMAYRSKIGRDWTMEFVSEGSAAVTGYDPDDLIGNTVVAYGDLIHPDDRERVWEQVREALAAHRSYELEYRILTSEGEVRWVWEQGRGVYPENDHYQAREGFITDMSEQVEAREEVQNRNRQLSVINEIIRLSSTAPTLECLVETMLKKILELLSMEGGMIYLVDRDREEARVACSVGMPATLLAARERIGIRDPSMSAVFIEGIPRYEDELEIGSGEGIRSCATIPLTADGVVVGAMVVTSGERHPFTEEERLILEAIGRELGSSIQKALLQTALKRAHEEANLYLDIMSHDINNANTASIGYAEFLIGSLKGTEGNFARKLLASVQKSVEIIGNVTTIRRLREQKTGLKPVSLDAVIQNEINRFSDTDITHSGRDVTVTADDLLSEVFTNLIGNAIKFGGTDVAISINVEEQNGEVLVSVADNGPGIPDEEKSEVFFRFRRGTSAKSGKGLGLYISRMLIEQYGGKIWAEDRIPGRHEEGALMRFTLRKAPSG